MSGSVSMIDGHIDPDTNRMTDEEKIRYLNKCEDREQTVVVIWKVTEQKPDKITIGDVVDIINRQQAENSNLTSDLTSLQNDLTSAKAEIKRLTTLAKLGNMRADDYRAMRDKCKTARAEAIKEFAERLKEDLGIWNFDFTYYADRAEARGYIDNLVKEMVGK